MRWYSDLEIEDLFKCGPGTPTRCGNACRVPVPNFFSSEPWPGTPIFLPHILPGRGSGTPLLFSVRGSGSPTLCNRAGVGNLFSAGSESETPYSLCQHGGRGRGSHFIASVGIKHPSGSGLGTPPLCVNTGSGNPLRFSWLVIRSITPLLLFCDSARLGPHFYLCTSFLRAGVGLYSVSQYSSPSGTDLHFSLIVTLTLTVSLSLLSSGKTSCICDVDWGG